MAAARFANFGSNISSLALYALSGHIFVPAGLARGVGVFSALALVRTPLCEPARGWCGRSSSS